MFLTRNEIKELTGYTYKKKQQQWLIDNGYKFSIRCDGFPNVLLSYIENQLGGNTQRNIKQEFPDADALMKVLNNG